MCIDLSLANINSLQPFFEIKPDMIGLSKKAEVTRYLSIAKGSLEENCAKEVELVKAGANEQRVELFWEKVRSKQVEQAR